MTINLPTVALGGTGVGMVFLYFIRDVARDAWNDYRRGKQLRAAAAAARDGQAARPATDVGSMLAHDLIAVINKDLDAMRAKADQDQAREDKRYTVVEGLASQVKELTMELRQLTGAVGKQTETLMQQGTKLDLIALRGAR